VSSRAVKIKIPVTIEAVRDAHRNRQTEIQTRLAEFAAIWNAGTDETLFEELVFCIFTANASARMGIRSVAAVKNLLHRRDVSAEELALALTGVHRFPNARSRYIAVTREFLQEDCQMRLRRRIESFSDSADLRDWLVKERRIKGLGYKEASHFLRNVGFRGLAILDKHILNSLTEIGVIETAKPPATRSRYLAVEQKMRQFALDVGIDFDELDLVLWSLKTGEILK
jgi:N-glycosylase/DNA lyase